ncbi:hypothetical protein FNF29_06584 [Cafeteria roenbergensis]|uniref:Uncharacterized protein n=1 Tax=Cafeteria roenbergensis TaxID=33653 RepID=A0A5A8C668_CAFRO|nr:hypothetical protein FNF29_06584 [Cafeteria roenbergensis]|eukprot:KAA0148526.1 hypothetical protein FNF29_06584 [Cafeteria roenbergensis]
MAAMEPRTGLTLLHACCVEAATPAGRPLADRAAEAAHGSLRVHGSQPGPVRALHPEAGSSTGGRLLADPVVGRALGGPGAELTALQLKCIEAVDTCVPDGLPAEPDPGHIAAAEAAAASSPAGRHGGGQMDDVWDADADEDDDVDMDGGEGSDWDRLTGEMEAAGFSGADVPHGDGGIGSGASSPLLGSWGGRPDADRVEERRLLLDAVGSLPLHERYALALSFGHGHGDDHDHDDGSDDDDHDDDGSDDGDDDENDENDGCAGARGGAAGVGGSGSHGGSRCSTSILAAGGRVQGPSSGSAAGPDEAFGAEWQARSEGPSAASPGRASQGGASEASRDGFARAGCNASSGLPSRGRRSVFEEVVPGLNDDELATALHGAGVAAGAESGRAVRGAVEAAMGLMHSDERTAVETDARRIQRNVRMWLLRRNYRALRSAARRVQLALRARRERGQLSRAREATRTIQASIRGHLVRRDFALLRRQAAAAMVIQRALKSRARDAAE